MLINCGTCRHAVWERTPSGRLKKNVAGQCGANGEAVGKLVDLVYSVKIPGNRREALESLLDGFTRYPIWIWFEAYSDCEAWEPKDG